MHRLIFKRARPHLFIVEVQGETAHSGPWPMDKRRNANVVLKRAQR